VSSSIAKAILCVLAKKALLGLCDLRISNSP
jgi:hypothetical protein